MLDALNKADIQMHLSYWRIASFEVAHVPLPSAKSKDCQDFEINISHDVKVVQSFLVFLSVLVQKEPFVLK